MTSIIPIPTTRISNLLIQNGLTLRLQNQQRELLTLQSQVSSGFRISQPSEDPRAASVALSLQRVLEQHAQFGINLDTGQAFLAASDQALGNAVDVTTNIRGLAVRAGQALLSEGERNAFLTEIQQALDQLVRVGNSEFRGRHLFAGSTTAVTPYETEGGLVAFRGNEEALRSYADRNILLQTNLSGQDLLGGATADVVSLSNYGPVLTSETRLDDLRGGAGIRRGGFEVSDGLQTSTVDISGAETLGDVVVALEGNPPQGRSLGVRITPTGLELELDDAGGGNLIVRDVEGGKAAADLGIENDPGAGSPGPLIGEALSPIVRPTTPLANVLGVRAQAVWRSPGSDNDLLIEAVTRGVSGNDFTFQFVDDELLEAAPGLAAGNENTNLTTVALPARASLALSGVDNDLILTAVTPGTDFNGVAIEIQATNLGGDDAVVSYNGAAKTLTLQIDNADRTTLGTLVARINASGVFTAVADPSAGEGFQPANTVAAANAGTTTGNTGNSGAVANTVLVHIEVGQSSAEQVAAALNLDPAVTALFSVSVDDTDASSSILAGTGPVDVDASAVTAGGSGVEPDLTSGFLVTQAATEHLIDVSNAETVEDLLNAFRSSPADLLAEIRPDGLGIAVRSRLSGADFSIGENGGTTATDFGLRSLHAGTPLGDLNRGRGVDIRPGVDLQVRRRDGVLLDIDLDGAAVVQDVVDRINQHVLNQDATPVVARLTATGNGLELVDDNGPGTDTLAVLRVTGSQAAWDLGWITDGTNIAAADAGTPNLLTAADVNPREAGSVFNSLVRLQQAVESGDFEETGRIASRLDDDLDRLSLGRAVLGIRSRGVDAQRLRQQDEEIELRSALSREIEVDLVQAISDLTTRQAAFQASLETTARTLGLSLLDFI